MRGVMARGAGLGEMYMARSSACSRCAPSSCGRRFDATIAALWAIVALIAIHLCAGDNGKILPVLVKHLPGFGCCASRAVQARRGVADRGGRGVWRRRARGGGGTCAVPRGSAWRWRWSRSRSPLVDHRPEVNPPREVWWSIAAAIAAAALVAAIVFAPERWKGMVVAAIALAVLVDAPWFSYTDKVLPAADAQSITRATTRSCRGSSA